MADYSEEKCPTCKNDVGNVVLHCMKCIKHRTGPAVHMICRKCKKEWLVEIKSKEEK